MSLQAWEIDALIDESTATNAFARRVRACALELKAARIRLEELRLPPLDVATLRTFKEQLTEVLRDQDRPIDEHQTNVLRILGRVIGEPKS